MRLLAGFVVAIFPTPAKLIRDLCPSKDGDFQDACPTLR